MRYFCSIFLFYIEIIPILGYDRNILKLEGISVTEQELKNTIAANLAAYRKRSGITQLRLAEQLNYSDKAVSKWERGESLPDIYVLYQMTQIFGITMNDLLGEKTKNAKISEPAADLPHKRRNRKFITSMSVCLVWLVMSVVFVALELFHFSFFAPWLVYIYALPISCIVLLVFACIWWSVRLQAVSVSGIIWFTALSLFLTLPAPHMAFIFIPAAVLQLLTILWFRFRSLSRSRSKQEEEK